MQDPQREKNVIRDEGNTATYTAYTAMSAILENKENKKSFLLLSWDTPLTVFIATVEKI